MLENAKRRRLVCKQRAPALWVLPPATLAALADEARSEVVAVVAVVRFPPPEPLPAVAHCPPCLPLRVWLKTAAAERAWTLARHGTAHSV